MREMPQRMEMPQRPETGRLPQQAAQAGHEGEREAVHQRPWARIVEQLGSSSPGWRQRLLLRVEHLVEQIELLLWRLLMQAMSRPVHGPHQAQQEQSVPAERAPSSEPARPERRDRAAAPERIDLDDALRLARGAREGLAHTSGREPAEIVYRLPSLSSSDSVSSLGGIREPQAATGALDRDAPNQEMARNRRPRPGPPLHKGTGPHVEPFGMLDLEELPETYGYDEVEVLCKDPAWAFVYWEVTEAGLEAARAQLGASATGARLVLRLFTTTSSGSPGGPVSAGEKSGPAGPGGAASTAGRETHDVPLLQVHGRRYVEIHRPGAQLRAAVGLLSAEGYFASIAHSSLVRMPPLHPSSTTAHEWMKVQQPRGRGEVREHLTVLGRYAAYEERSVPWRVSQAGYAAGTSAPTVAPLNIAQRTGVSLGGPSGEGLPWQESGAAPGGQQPGGQPEGPEGAQEGRGPLGSGSGGLA